MALLPCAPSGCLATWRADPLNAACCIFLTLLSACGQLLLPGAIVHGLCLQLVTSREDGCPGFWNAESRATRSLHMSSHRPRTCRIWQSSDMAATTISPH